MSKKKYEKCVVRQPKIIDQSVAYERRSVYGF
jgi:hypothetical protein